VVDGYGLVDNDEWMGIWVVDGYGLVDNGWLHG
jgi:hypothetical protein